MPVSVAQSHLHICLPQRASAGAASPFFLLHKCRGNALRPMPFRRIANAYLASRPGFPAFVQKHTGKGSYIREIPGSSAAERKRKSLRTTPCEKLCVDDTVPLPVSIFQDAPWCLVTPERDLPSGGIFPEVQETPFESLPLLTSTEACENLRK